MAYRGNVQVGKDLTAPCSVMAVRWPTAAGPGMLWSKKPVGRVARDTGPGRGGRSSAEAGRTRLPRPQAVALAASSGARHATRGRRRAKPPPHPGVPADRGRVLRREGPFGFRVVHCSVQGNHIHLIAEAE